MSPTVYELESLAAKMIEADGWPDKGTDLAELVIGYFAELDKRHQPRVRYRMGKSSGVTCTYDNHRWPCDEAAPR